MKLCPGVTSLVAEASPGDPEGFNPGQPPFCPMQKYLPNRLQLIPTALSLAVEAFQATLVGYLDTSC